MKSFIVTALLLTSVYASAQGMGGSSAAPSAAPAAGGSIVAPAGNGASTGVNPNTGTSLTPASGSSIDRSTTPATPSTNGTRQNMDDTNLREGRKIETKDKMLNP